MKFTAILTRFLNLGWELPIHAVTEHISEHISEISHIGFSLSVLEKRTESCPVAQTLREANQMTLKGNICSFNYTSFVNHNDRCLSRHQTFCTSNLGCRWWNEHHWLYQYFLWMFISQSDVAKVLTFVATCNFTVAKWLTLFYTNLCHQHFLQSDQVEKLVYFPI